VHLKIRVPTSVCKDSYEQVLKEFSKQAKVRRPLSFLREQMP
jgi:hypothetical protein